MRKKQTAQIDSLFGSKTRVKLLYLFFNNPGKSFYVREITRLVDEQINSVRRELSNLLEIGVIVSMTADNKLYYEVNQRYEYYGAFRSIFASDPATIKKSKKDSSGMNTTDQPSWTKGLRTIKTIRVAVAAGVLVPGSASEVDLLVVGQKTPKLATLIKDIEASEGRELTYTVMSYDEFYYRLSVRDRFITELLSNRHEVVTDADKILKSL